MALGREPSRSDPLSVRDIRLALGGLHYDRDIVYKAWDFRPSLGIVAKDIERLGLDIRSFKEPLSRSVKKVMIPSFRKNFESGGRPEGWEPLSEATIKLRGYSAWPILVRSGALKKGATQFNIWDIGQTSATIRRLPNKIWYGVVHQQGIGGYKPSKDKFTKPDAKKEHAVTIPQRQFILFQEQDIDDIEEVFYDWLVERTVAVGRFSR